MFQGGSWQKATRLTISLCCIIHMFKMRRAASCQSTMFLRRGWFEIPYVPLSDVVSTGSASWYIFRNLFKQRAPQSSIMILQQGLLKIVTKQSIEDRNRHWEQTGLFRHTHPIQWYTIQPKMILHRKKNDIFLHKWNISTQIRKHQPRIHSRN